jgi:MraZ protein
MEPEKPVARKYFNSLVRHGVDPQRRVQVPSKWRPGEPDSEFTLFVWRHGEPGASVRVLPPDKWRKLVDKIEAMPDGDPKRVLTRLIGSESCQVPLDKAGRMLLPPEMAREAEIENEVVMVGLLDCFDLWNPQKYERVRASDRMMAPDALKLIG